MLRRLPVRAPQNRAGREGQGHPGDRAATTCDSTTMARVWVGRHLFCTVSGLGLRDPLVLCQFVSHTALGAREMARVWVSASWGYTQLRLSQPCAASRYTIDLSPEHLCSSLQSIPSERKDVSVKFSSTSCR